MGESAIFGRQLGEQAEGIGWPDGMREASRRALELGKHFNSKFETRLTLPGAADSIEGPLGKAHRRPSICALHKVSDCRKEACNQKSATA